MAEEAAYLLMPELAVQVMKPKDFAQQINLNMDNCWGIVRALVDLCMKQEDGKYLLVKDPNKQLLRLYSVPEDAFQVGPACKQPSHICVDEGLQCVADSLAGVPLIMHAQPPCSCLS